MQLLCKQELHNFEHSSTKRNVFRRCLAVRGCNTIAVRNYRSSCARFPQDNSSLLRRTEHSIFAAAAFLWRSCRLLLARQSSPFLVHCLTESYGKFRGCREHLRIFGMREIEANCVLVTVRFAGIRWNRVTLGRPCAGCCAFTGADSVAASWIQERAGWCNGTTSYVQRRGAQLIAHESRLR